MSAEGLALRPASSDDADLLLRWRNDAETRAQSLDSNVVPREAHIRWLAQRLSDGEACRIWIAELEGQPVGQARVDRRSSAGGEISVSVDAAARGRGLGTMLIRLATERARAEMGLRRLEAVVKPQNAASLAAFRRAAYARGRTERRHDADVVVLEWRDD